MEEKNKKPLGRFQSTYTKELGTEPNYEDYAFATRHGGRDIQAKGKSNIGTRFKFPTQVSSYGMDYCNLKAPKLEDYGENKQPCNDRKVECAALAGYNTTYNDGSFVLRHQDQLEGKDPGKGNAISQNKETSKEHTKDEPRRIFGPWNYTGQLKEDILIQRDKPLRIEKELYHLPGYMGHQPLHNPPSSTAYRRRSSEKEKMLLYDLDQYSRELWPHYKGHKAQALINVKEPPPPNTATTYGYTNHMMQKQQAWSKANNHTRVVIPEKHKKATTKDFFTQGASGSTSANGLMMAEKFYSFYRPLEGTLISFQADKALASKYLD